MIFFFFLTQRPRKLIFFSWTLDTTITRGISFCQWKHAIELIKDTGLHGCEPAKGHMQSNLKLSNNSGEFLSDPTSYRILMCEAFMSDTY